MKLLQELGTVKSSTKVFHYHLLCSMRCKQSAISGRSRILKKGVPVCTWLLYLAKCNKAHEAHLLGGSGGHAPLPSEKLISRLFLAPFWHESWTTYRYCPIPVIVFEAFKRSQNLKVQLCFAPETPQSSCEALEKKENFSYQKALCILPFMRREHCIK